MREELQSLRPDPKKPEEILSYLAGFLVTGGELGIGGTPKVTIAFRHAQSALLASACLCELYGYHAEIGVGAASDKRGAVHAIELPATVSRRLLIDTRMLRVDDEAHETYVLGYAAMRWVKARAYCAALYLEAGRLYTGEDYRLDLVLPQDERRQKELEAMLSAYDIHCHVVPARDKLRLSIRREAVATFLALIGASSSSLTVTDYYVERSVNRSVTRAINCSTNNMDKAYRAATNQLWAIGVLKKAGVYGTLSADVRAVGDARLANPEASLQQLSDVVGISKATLHRRMQVILDAAQPYKGE